MNCPRVIDVDIIKKSLLSQRDLGEKTVYLAYNSKSKQVLRGKEDRNSKNHLLCKQHREWMLGSLFACLLYSSTLWVPCVGNGATHNGLDSHRLINGYDTLLQTHSQKSLL